MPGGGEQAVWHEGVLCPPPTGRAPCIDEGRYSQSAKPEEEGGELNEAPPPRNGNHFRTVTGLPETHCQEAGCGGDESRKGATSQATMEGGRSLPAPPHEPWHFPPPAQARTPPSTQRLAEGDPVIYAKAGRGLAPTPHRGWEVQPPASTESTVGGWAGEPPPAFLAAILRSLGWGVGSGHLVGGFQHLHQESVDGGVPNQLEEEEVLQALQPDGPEGRQTQQQLGKPGRGGEVRPSVGRRGLLSRLRKAWKGGNAIGSPSFLPS